MSAPAAPLPLTETDKAILGRIAASTASPHREVIRAKVLLAAGEGIANSIIASTYGLAAVTVRAWRKDYHTDGLTRFGVIASGRGRKRSIDDATIIDLVEKTMHQNPPRGAHSLVGAHHGQGSRDLSCHRAADLVDPGY